MALTISRAAEAAMLAHAASDPDREVCGLLLGSGDVITTAVATANVADHPAHAFEIDPVALIGAHRAARTGGLQVLGHYHSHPNGRTTPSATDQALAAGDEACWAIVAHGRIGYFVASARGLRPHDVISGE